MKTKIYDLTPYISRVVRNVFEFTNGTPMTVNEEDSCGPRIAGHSYYFTTPGGKRINHPNSYGWPMVYHHSTRTINVGANWIKKISTPPKGCYFTFSRGNGLCVVRKSDGLDYHPTRNDFLAINFKTNLRKKMAAKFLECAKARKSEKELKAFNYIFQKELHSTQVNLLDSRRAGNCIEGSLKFAEAKLRIPREEILTCPWLVQVPAQKLLRISDNQNEILRSIKQAFLRETVVSI